MQAHWRAAVEWIQTVPLSGTVEGEKLRKLAEMDLRHAINNPDLTRWAEAHFLPVALVERHKGERLPDWERTMLERATIAVMKQSDEVVRILAGFREVARETAAENPPKREPYSTLAEAPHRQPDPLLYPTLKEILKERTDEFRVRATLDGTERPRMLSLALIADRVGISRARLALILADGNPRRSLMKCIAAACGWTLARLEEEIYKKAH